MLKRTAHLYLAPSIALTGFAWQRLGRIDRRRRRCPCTRGTTCRTGRTGQVQEIPGSPGRNRPSWSGRASIRHWPPNAASLSLRRKPSNWRCRWSLHRAGGDVLGAILLVFFVLLVTDILGFTQDLPFTRSVR